MQPTAGSAYELHRFTTVAVVVFMDVLRGSLLELGHKASFLRCLSGSYTPASVVPHSQQVLTRLPFQSCRVYVLAWYRRRPGYAALRCVDVCGDALHL